MQSYFYTILKRIKFNEVIEYIYLKDNWDIGKTWTAPITDSGLLNGFPAQIIGKIVEKDITKVVDGKTYTNVIHTHL